MSIHKNIAFTKQLFLLVSTVTGMDSFEKYIVKTLIGSIILY